MHLEEDGASYRGTYEEFLTGQGNPVSDIVIHPDGAMYFVTGGRRNVTSLYRVVYQGQEDTAAVERTDSTPQGAKARALRRDLEERQRPGAAQDWKAAWQQLAHSDRKIRFAARTVLDHQPPERWARKAFSETNAVKVIESMIAMVRHEQQDLKTPILAKLNQLPFGELALEQQIDLLRTYGLAFIRLGGPGADTRQHLLRTLSPRFPAGTRSLDHELCQMLLYLESPEAVRISMQLLLAADTQSEQMFYAYHLRTAKDGWSAADRLSYFEWIFRTQSRRDEYIGGDHFANFLKMLDKEASERLSQQQREAMDALREQRVEEPPVVELGPRPVVQQWQLADLVPLLSHAESGRSFLRGRRLYEGLCAQCHLFKGKGGALGPDLTSSGKKLTHAALLTEILEPSKVISDQHASIILQLESGKVVTGREVGGDAEQLLLVVDPLQPRKVTKVSRSAIVTRRTSPISLMPLGLLNTLSGEEVLDLLLYVSSSGERSHRAFQQ